MKLTYSIKTVLRPDKKKADNTIPIHYSIRVGPTATRIPTGKFTLLSDWNTKDNSPKKVTKHGQLLSAFLSKKISEWNNYMLTEESLGKAITLTKAMGFFRENTKVTLFSFIDEQISLWSEIKEINTLKSYRSMSNVLREFNPKLNFGDLTFDCIEKFDKYMRQTRHNSTGGCFTKHKCLKSIINQAIKKGYMNEMPYKYFKIKSAVGSRKFLSIEEVQRIMHFEIEENTFLSRTRDLFLFSVFTGLRYSDCISLRWEHIKENPDCIKMKMTKTSREITIPLNEYAKAILAKTVGCTIKSAQLRALPKMANQVVNRGLKDLMKDVGIDKSISFHSARHTFASNHVQSKTNIVHLKDLLGHSNLDQTQIYAKSLQSDLFESMTKLESLYSHAV